jgi:hypothetical protein
MPHWLVHEFLSHVASLDPPSRSGDLEVTYMAQLPGVRGHPKSPRSGNRQSNLLRCMTPDHGRVQRLEWPLWSKGRAKRAERTDLKGQLAAEWLAFPDLPGWHLSMRKAGRRTYKLVDDGRGAVLASCRHRYLSVFPDSITREGHTHTWQRFGKRRVHRRSLLAEDRILDLVDVASKDPVMRLAGKHVPGIAGTRVTLTGQGPLQFHVRGNPESALMSVVSDSGEKLIEFRLVRSKRRSPLDYLGWAEIVVDPNVSQCSVRRRRRTLSRCPRCS